MSRCTVALLASQTFRPMAPQIIHLCRSLWAGLTVSGLTISGHLASFLPQLVCAPPPPIPCLFSANANNIWPFSSSLRPKAERRKVGGADGWIDDAEKCCLLHAKGRGSSGCLGSWCPERAFRRFMSAHSPPLLSQMTRPSDSHAEVHGKEKVHAVQVPPL